MLKLSPRLNAFYERLLPHQSVWDFCCDHGYVGLKALESENHPHVHFVDPVPHLIKKIQIICEKREARGAFFHTSLGEDLNERVDGTVVIAGVGAETIIKILDSLHQKGLLMASRLVLSPHRHEERLEFFMNKLGSIYECENGLSCEIPEPPRTRGVHVFTRVKKG